MLTGECECGLVRYSVEDAFLYAANCHCSRCRAATGSAFKPFAGIEREKLEVAAERLANGNTLITRFDQDRGVEINLTGNEVWSYKRSRRVARMFRR